MKLSKATIKQLTHIIKEEFNTELNSNESEKLAYALVGYFDLILKVNNRHKFVNRPSRVIEQIRKKSLDRKGVK